MPNIENGALEAALQKLADVAPDYSVEETLQDIVTVVVTVFPIAGAGLLFLDGDDALRYVAASDDVARELEVAQEELGVGPCVDCLVLDTPIATDDVGNDPRWPGLAERIVPDGVRAVLGVPVRAGAAAIGTLNVYYANAHSWDSSEIDALGKFARIIENVVGHALLAHERGKLAQQLQYALDNRVVIERAIGLLMGRAGDVDAVAAFNRLRALARAERRRVGEVAGDVLTGTIDL
jgi:GAF domain-containing protein